MRKEFKAVIWVGILFFIYFLYALVDGNKEDAHQIIDVLLYGYIGFAALSVIEGTYKWIKKPFPKKDI